MTNDISKKVTSFIKERYPELLFYSCVALLITMRCISNLRDEYVYSYNWNVSEWMINYSNGFIRRGLSGEIILFIVKTTHCSILTILTILTSALYIATCHCFVKSVNSHNYPPSERLLLIFNPIFVLFAALFSDLFYRKDIVFILFAIICAGMAGKIISSQHSKQKYYVPTYITFVLILSIALILTHEGIGLFLWMPVSILLLWLVVKQCNISPIKTRIVIAAAILVQLFTFAMCCIFHGDIIAAKAIAHRWTENGTAFDQYSVPPAIDGISWSLSKGLSYSAELMSLGRVFLTMFFVVCLILLTTAILVVISKNSHDNGLKLKTYIIVFTYILICSLPLYVIGCDWGRWFFITQTLTFVLFSCQPLSNAIRENVVTQILERKDLDRFLDWINSKVVYLSKTRNINARILILILFTPCGIIPFSTIESCIRGEFECILVLVMQTFDLL